MFKWENLKKTLQISQIYGHVFIRNALAVAKCQSRHLS